MDLIQLAGPKGKGRLGQKYDFITLVAAAPVESHETAPAGIGKAFLGDLHFQPDAVANEGWGLEVDMVEGDKGKRGVVKFAGLFRKAAEKEQHEFAWDKSASETDHPGEIGIAKHRVNVAGPLHHLLGLASVHLEEGGHEAVANLEAVVGARHSVIE